MPHDRVELAEISELFSNPSNLQNDFNEAFGLMREHMQKKYIGKMKQAITSCQMRVNENPSPEVKLLHAFKPFVAKESHSKINDFIEMLQTVNALKEINNHFSETKVSAASANMEPEPISGIKVQEHADRSSIHEDGIYDIDSNCYLGGYAKMDNMAGMIMLMSMATLK